MQQSDGWKHMSGWLDQKEQQALTELKSKNFSDLAEVKVLQARLTLIKELRGEIVFRISPG
ncbi:MAG TPA: hypothetical protein VN462_00250, partial [Negativicutes bacterium]|nr:hypothetical protein [Negativicutes bacterium]